MKNILKTINEFLFHTEAKLQESQAQKIYVAEKVLAAEAKMTSKYCGIFQNCVEPQKCSKKCAHFKRGSVFSLGGVDWYMHEPYCKLWRREN